MTTGEIIHNFRAAGIYPRLKGAGRLQVIALPEDLTDERRAELKQAAPAIRAYLFREAWVNRRIGEWFYTAEQKHPDGIDWNLHTDLEGKFLELCEEYQNAPIGSATDEVKWRERIDAMLVDYITERKKENPNESTDDHRSSGEDVQPSL